MQLIFHQLGHLLLGSIPTILLFVALHYYLKWMLYRPLQRTMRERDQRIAGRKEAARLLVERAAQKLAGYESSLRGRRLENFKLIEARRQEGLALGQGHISTARRQAAETMVAARQKLAEQTTNAHTHLRASAESLAQQIVAQVLRPQPAKQPAPGVGA
ncbi:MAG: hypothetical protein ACRD04_14195 [Terriglobales bacterium]